jgi:energy-coupling factor transporter ATP-binding protein EcfA2
MPIRVDFVILPFSGLQVEHWISPERGVYALVGPNGAGKSQWLSFLSGLLKVRRSRVQHGGHRIGLIMQNPEQQISAETVAGELLWAIAPRLRAQRLFQERLATVRERWQMDDTLWKLSPWALSTGQQRRLLFAVYDLLDPDILLLDEPSEGLDGYWTGRLSQWIAKRAQSHFVLVATHDWAWALSFIDKGYWCEKSLPAHPEDLGALWYQHHPVSEDPLENLWRDLLDCHADVSVRAWIDPELAAEQAVKLCSSP